MSFDWGVNGNQSGVAIKLNNLELLESREDDVGKYTYLEKEIYEIEKQIALVEAGANLPNEIEFPDPENERNKWDWLFSHNLASPIDYLKSKDAELTDDQAEELITKNKGLNNPIPEANGNGLLQALGKPVDG